MRFTVISIGDRSVGIWPNEFVLEVVGLEPANLSPDDRQWFKESLKDMMEKYDGTPANYVYAEDECPDCGAGGYKDGKCARESCVHNIPDEEDVISNATGEAMQAAAGKTIAQPTSDFRHSE